MKNCAYCGRENMFDAVYCAECGASEFVAPALGASSSKQEVAPSKPDVLVPDRPKIVIVAGIWTIFGSGLIGNIFVLYAILNGAISGMLGFFCFCLAVACGALCAYLLYRVVNNYTLHKKRLEHEAVVQPCR